jgi:hypothetical protein
MAEVTMIPCCFAIIPDRSHQPLAMFADLQDAMDWGLNRLGGDSFRIKYIAIARVEQEDEQAPVQSEEVEETVEETFTSTAGRLLS